VASSEEKRHVQNVKRHARNQSVKSRIKTEMKKVATVAASGDAAAAEAELRTAMSTIQKAGRERILHPNTAARRIARLSRLVHKSKSTATPASQ
jgi:small subunit ribosomal protein S20